MADKPGLESIRDQLERLRRNYIAGLPTQLAELECLVQGASGGADARERLTRLQEQLHKLAGSAGSFGQPALGEAARVLENQLRDADPQGGNLLSETLAAQITGLGDLITQQPAASGDGGQVATEDRGGNGVWVLETDLARGRDLGDKLAPFNYQLRLFCDSQCLLEAAATQVPDCLLIDAAFLESKVTEEEAAAIWIERLKAQGTQLVVLSDRDDFSLRVRAVRLGALGFQVRPLDIPKLVERIQRGAKKLWDVPGRVTIIDDDRVLAQYYRLMLQRAGFEAELLAHPETLVEEMHLFQPELVLMDLHMPDYSGPDLAGVIRQYDGWASLPIVYLSAETDLGLQMHALSHGADDFLTKPVCDTHLVTSVRARIERARQISAQIVRDSLTGLLKHAAIKEAVEQELQRSIRTGQPLTLAMLDIDHFKHVNDSYGHVVGDAVIAAVATLLNQRLRQSDVIGRYGGEEFLVALPNCELITARRLMEDICQRFAEVEFSAGEQHFSCTVSAGIASTAKRHEISSEVLLAEADKALYRAKHSGRNRVCDLTSDPSIEPGMDPS